MKPKAGRIQEMALVMSVGGLWLLPLSPLSAQEPKLRATLKGHTEAVWSVAFSPDGKTLASAGGLCGKPGEIQLWDVATGKERATPSPSGYLNTMLQKIQVYIDQVNIDVVRSVAYSPDGKTLASGSRNKTIKLWDVATGKQAGQ